MPALTPESPCALTFASTLQKADSALEAVRLEQDNSTLPDFATAGNDDNATTRTFAGVTVPHPHHGVSLFWLSVSDSLLHYSFWSFAWAAILAGIALLGSVLCFVLPPNPWCAEPDAL